MSHVRELTDDTFESSLQESDVPALVDFSASWCQPCKALAPTIEAVAKEYSGRLNVFKVDIDEAQESSSHFGIQGVPTCVLFKDGKEVDRFMGNKDLRSIKERVDRLLE
jgi:thioredoxin 1